MREMFNRNNKVFFFSERSLLSKNGLALKASCRDFPEAAYFGPGARTAEGPKSAVSEAMDGVANVS